MQAKRILFALLTAVVVSGCFTLWLGSRLAHSRAKNTGGLHYVAAAKGVDAGEVLAAENLQFIDWPGNVPLQGSFVRVEDVVGKTVLYPLAEGQPILNRQLAMAGSGLAGRIPEGMRAISLRSNEVVGVAGYLLPGTRVDVLVTVRSATSQEPLTSTVLQDTQVLTAGQKMEPDPDGRANRVDVVTLLVSPDDAEKVVLASTQGTVHFVLRNGLDHSRAVRQSASMSSLGSMPASTAVAALAPIATPSPVRTTMTAATRASAQPHYTIQVRRGDKDSVETIQ
jgi:pilus assembly protein CpaB